jgi:hypothetical protein
VYYLAAAVSVAQQFLHGAKMPQYNGDVPGFKLSPKTEKVLSLKQNRSVYGVDHGPAKIAIMTMFLLLQEQCACQ